MNNKGEKETAAAGGKTGTRDSLGGKRKELCFSHAELEQSVNDYLIMEIYPTMAVN